MCSETILSTLAVVCVKIEKGRSALQYVRRNPPVMAGGPNRSCSILFEIDSISQRLTSSVDPPSSVDVLSGG